MKEVKLRKHKYSITERQEVLSKGKSGFATELSQIFEKIKNFVKDSNYIKNIIYYQIRIEKLEKSYTSYAPSA